MAISIFKKNSQEVKDTILEARNDERSIVTYELKSDYDIKLNNIEGKYKLKIEKLESDKTSLQNKIKKDKKTVIESEKKYHEGRSMVNQAKMVIQAYREASNDFLKEQHELLQPLRRLDDTFNLDNEVLKIDKHIENEEKIEEKERSEK